MTSFKHISKAVKSSQKPLKSVIFNNVYWKLVESFLPLTVKIILRNCWIFSFTFQAFWLWVVSRTFHLINSSCRCVCLFSFLVPLNWCHDVEFECLCLQETFIDALKWLCESHFGLFSIIHRRNCVGFSYWFVLRLRNRRKKKRKKKEKKPRTRTKIKTYPSGQHTEPCVLHGVWKTTNKLWRWHIHKTKEIPIDFR